MARRWGTGWTLLLLAANPVAAQTVPPLALPPVVLPAGADMPPLAVTPTEQPVLPNGTPVSRPLEAFPFGTDADVFSVLPGELSTARTAETVTPLGRSWHTYEYLLWWPKAHPLPPLAVAGPVDTTPTLGGPSTTLLVGGRSLDAPDTSGGRFTYGFATDDAHTRGLEVTYLFLGTQTTTARADAAVGRNRVVGRPLIDPADGSEYVTPVIMPGTLAGGMSVSTTTRVSGWEVNGVANVVHVPGATINVLAGYRYFLANEGLRVEQVGWRPGAGTFPAVLLAADQFDAHNRFHGGQLGLTADLGEEGVFVELGGKIGLGRAIQVVKASGQSVVVQPGFPFPLASPAAGGVLGQGTNAGRASRSGFAVLPEATARVGYRSGDRSKLYVGYNFLYLSDAVRPGDQVDRAVSPGFLPTLLQPPGVAAAATDRPAPLLERTDFWVQGLVFGLEYRY